MLLISIFISGLSCNSTDIPSMTTPPLSVNPLSAKMLFNETYTGGKLSARCDVVRRVAQLLNAIANVINMTVIFFIVNRIANILFFYGRGKCGESILIPHYQTTNHNQTTNYQTISLLFSHFHQNQTAASEYAKRH